MEFKVEVLDQKNIEGKQWILCKGNLADYLGNLKDNFYDFAIQRRIVENQYLDSIFHTVKKGEPVPMITLTFRGGKVIIADDLTATIEMDQVEILDGLQRSFRLWSYLNIAHKYDASLSETVLEFAKRVKTEAAFRLMFEAGVMSTSIIKELIASGDILEMQNIFKLYDVYLVLWVGLNETETVRKMLVLNAGQKQVSKVHQFELLFLHIWDEIRNNAEIKILREKDANSSAIKRGDRTVGEFMFSSVIVSLMSLAEKKPMRVSTENLMTEHSEEDVDAVLYQNIFNKSFVKAFLDQLLSIDQIILDVEGDYGKSWFVKDTTLSGLFAAVGNDMNLDKTQDMKTLEASFSGSMTRLAELIASKGLDLENFKREYDSFSSRSVNIGSHIRKVIALHIEHFLSGNILTWQESFLKIKEGK